MLGDVAIRIGWRAPRTSVIAQVACLTIHAWNLVCDRGRSEPGVGAARGAWPALQNAPCPCSTYRVSLTLDVPVHVIRRVDGACELYPVVD
jgi:hypothetical protein